MITSSFPRWYGDWAGVFVLNMGKALIKIGHEVTIIAPHAAGCPKREVMEGVNVFRFRYAWPESLETLSYGEGMLNNVRKKPLRFLLILPFIVAQGIYLRRLFKGADIVNAHWLIPQGLVATLFRVRTILTLHGSDVNLKFRGPLGYLLRSVFRFVIKGVGAVTANSIATKKRLEEVVPGVDVNVIPMGVDVEFFSSGVGGGAEGSKVPKREESGERDNTVKIINVGRLIPLKGQEYLISALALIKEKFPNARLTLVGDGPYRERLVKHSQNAGVYDSVVFKNEVTHHEIPRLLYEHDIFVLPSVVMPTGETEGLGTVLIEAMAAGLPVVGSRVGGIGDIIEDGVNGILIEERSPQGICDAVIKIANDDDFRGRITRKAMEDVKERFSWEAIAPKFDELFNKVLRNEMSD